MGRMAGESPRWLALPLFPALHPASQIPYWARGRHNNNYPFILAWRWHFFGNTDMNGKRKLNRVGFLLLAGTKDKLLDLMNTITLHHPLLRIQEILLIVVSRVLKGSKMNSVPEPFNYTRVPVNVSCHPNKWIEGQGRCEHKQTASQAGNCFRVEIKNPYYTLF